MEPFGGYRASSAGSSLLGSVGERNAYTRSGLGTQAVDGRGRILEAKRRAEEYVKSAGQQADEVRSQGLMQGIGSVVSGALSSFGGSGAGPGISGEMSKIAKGGYTFPAGMSGVNGFNMPNVSLGGEIERIGKMSSSLGSGFNFGSVFGGQ